MSKIFKPRRGTTYTMRNTNKKSTVLAKGEMFIEVPNTGVGTGVSKLIIGDGITTYENLPIAISGVTTSDVTPDNSTTAFTALNNVISGKEMANLFGSLKKAISLTNTELTNTINEARTELTNTINETRNELTITINDNSNDLNEILNNRLSVDTDSGTSSFYFDYKEGRFGFNTDPERGADTFSPFSGKMQELLAEIRAASKINIYGQQYCPGSGQRPKNYYSYTATNVSYPGDTVTFRTGSCPVCGKQETHDRDWESMPSHTRTVVVDYSYTVNESMLGKYDT